MKKLLSVLILVSDGSDFAHAKAHIDGKVSDSEKNRRNATVYLLKEKIHPLSIIRLPIKKVSSP
jgi:hypothetical protein